MIPYNESHFGIPLLIRINGSALVQAIFPALASTLIFYGIVFGYYAGENLEDMVIAQSTYAFGCMLGAFAFFLQFRLGFAYRRYWESLGHVYNMFGALLEAANYAAAYHLQSDRYSDVRPLSYNQLNTHTSQPQDNILANSLKLRKSRVEFGVVRSKNNTTEADAGAGAPGSLFAGRVKNLRNGVGEINHASREDGGIDSISPYMLEILHLYSFAAAVACSTLRVVGLEDENNMEDQEMILAEYIPGSPWPAIDPDEQDKNRILSALKFIFGYSRVDSHREQYNKERPFRVLGGASEAEKRLISDANGVLAKVSLAILWPMEFVTREGIHGSSGKIHGAIQGVMQRCTIKAFYSYNQARKVAATPFPFPHTQVNFFYSLIVCFIVPCLMVSYGSTVYTAVTMNFFIVLIFISLHEVAREIEKPFKNPPNDHPLNFYMSQFNEALIACTAGYNPDSNWKKES